MPQTIPSMVRKLRVGWRRSASQAMRKTSNNIVRDLSYQLSALSYQPAAISPQPSAIRLRQSIIELPSKSGRGLRLVICTRGGWARHPLQKEVCSSPALRKNTLWPHQWRSDAARFFDMAMGSASELEYYVLLSHDLGFLASPAYQRLTREVTEVKRMLTSLTQEMRTGHSRGVPP